ncbi:alpha-ketoacid dehydrogenase subunit beta [Candidatus Pelagibacter sp.]|uniref:alpha-ketoacid dehydrogenase subunit beta n=1 Tax=Candidatus Pelagibacter sp. TaxID=2024849 RepID=UPI003F85FA9F
MPKRIQSFSKSINEALEQSMRKNKNVIIIGLGVDDPKGVFGTTKDLNQKFKKNRVFDMPTSENSLTGFAIGVALEGKRPVIVHQRVEFSLLSMDQIVNQAAKWFYMSGGKKPVPIVIRLIIGRGWGQGPQHSQSLESLFAHIPGLKVVCPSNPFNAKGLLNASIKDNNPVIFFEHRWLHETVGDVPKKYFELDLGKSRYVNRGKDLTIVAFSYTVLMSLKIREILTKNNISTEIIDLLSLRPLDTKKIISSAKKTKKVIIIDNGWMQYGVSAEISALINDKLGGKIKVLRVGNTDSPIPSTVSLAKHSYPSLKDTLKKISKICNKKILVSKKDIPNIQADQPDKSFLGPF